MKESEFIYRARYCYRPEHKLWEFRDSEGIEIGSIEEIVEMTLSTFGGRC